MCNGTGLIRSVDLQLVRKSLLISQVDAMRRALGLQRLWALPITNYSTRPGGAYSDADSRCMEIAANQARGLDAQEPRPGSKTHQSGECRNIAHVAARSGRLAVRVHRQWKDTAWVPTAEFLPDSTCSSNSRREASLSPPASARCPRNQCTSARRPTSPSRATLASRSRQRLAPDKSPRWIFNHAVSTIHSACRTLSPRFRT